MNFELKIGNTNGFRTNPISMCLSIFTILVLTYSGASQADGGEADPTFKLTLSSQYFSESGRGVDVNLRHSSGLGNTWVGFFDSNDLSVHQFRAGWDHSYGDLVRLSPSIQVASGGFVGGSINVETGKTWFLGAGYGRTNLLPYFNLNYDPNDAWTLSGGYRTGEGVSYSFAYTRDDRQNPDQQHFHAIYRTPINGTDRVTLDLLFKRGLVTGGGISRLGATLTYDWPRFFVKLAFDPNSNFTQDDVIRASIGIRF